jgi:hypothetical protein
MSRGLQEVLFAVGRHATELLGAESSEVLISDPTPGGTPIKVSVGMLPEEGPFRSKLSRPFELRRAGVGEITVGSRRTDAFAPL